ncbi:MAG: ATP-binding cassette domain-containing protein, partial [Pseudomonadota bacterium]
MTGPVLETRGLIRRFGGLTAVDDVSLSVPKGQIRALIGPNGAGKTTLVSLISGRIPPSAGRVFFEGRDVTALPAHRRIRAGMAYTFQITSVFARLSARENVRLAAHRRGSAAGRDAVETALSRTGILDRADQVAGD